MLQTLNETDAESFTFQILSNVRWEHLFWWLSKWDPLHVIHNWICWLVCWERFLHFSTKVGPECEWHTFAVREDDIILALVWQVSGQRVYQLHHHSPVNIIRQQSYHLHCLKTTELQHKENCRESIVSCCCHLENNLLNLSHSLEGEMASWEITIDGKHHGWYWRLSRIPLWMSQNKSDS